MKKIVLVILLIFTIFCGCINDTDRLSKAAFKLGVAYALKMNQEGAFRNLETVGEAANLAWSTYKQDDL